MMDGKIDPFMEENKSLIEKAESLIQNGNFREAICVFEELAGKAETANRPGKAARFYAEGGRCHLNLNDVNAAVEKARKAIRLSLNARRPELAIRIFRQTIKALEERGLNSEAESLRNEAQELRKKFRGIMFDPGEGGGAAGIRRGMTMIQKTGMMHNHKGHFVIGPGGRLFRGVIPKGGYVEGVMLPEGDANKDAVILREDFPDKCPTCGGPVSQKEASWVGPHTAECPYCGSPIKTRFEKM